MIVDDPKEWIDGDPDDARRKVDECLAFLPADATGVLFMRYDANRLSQRACENIHSLWINHGRKRVPGVVMFMIPGDMDLLLLSRDELRDMFAKAPTA